MENAESAEWCDFCKEPFKKPAEPEPKPAVSAEPKPSAPADKEEVKLSPEVYAKLMAAGGKTLEKK